MRKLKLGIAAALRPLIASCERADLRPLPNGVMVYGDGGERLERREIDLPL